ncbi:hook-length control protein FliK [Duganella sp. CF517]|uniref:flagellar hook-length control protein FliK n=1 Tax=Duganella sp. CF517 TaxID=1881038 RepID=UPI0008AC2ED2|nr:flagellar hook-length control protein FliK [Duganella sp. CF517]SEO14642.1 hook-length control protein FliK [Duganella sp. CF517]
MLPRFDAAVMPVRPADGLGAGAAVGDERQAAFQRVLQGMVGKSVTAEVMSRFNDGSSLVKVADNAVRMMLPPGVNVGDQVPLTVLTASPRPTFQLGTGTPGASPTVVYSEGAPADGGEALYSPSPPAAGQPGTGRAPAAAVPGQPGQAQADAADADAVPGQLRPGVPPGAPAAQAATPPALARPGADPASAAQGKPGDAAAAGRPLPAGAQAAGTPLPADAVKPHSLAATLLGKAPLTPSSELPELDHTTPQSTLSNTARALTTVLTTAQGGQVAQLALIGKTALFGGALPDTDALAQKLQDTISKSGLFYESHVTEWVKGERTLPELMREPQMQRMAHAGEQAAARAAANGPDLSAAQMINQQLHTHEQGRVQWQGEAWPGQPMQWDVRREQREKGRQDGGAGDDTPEQIWRSGVRFRFPLLGEVSAAVTLVGGQVHIQVQTGSDDSADTLRLHAGRLEQAMEAAGAPLSSLLITRDNAGDDGGGDGR